MVGGNDVFVRSRGVNEDGGENGGVLNGQNQTKTESLSPNIHVENGEWDVSRCHEAANKRIIFTPKENDQEVTMAETLLKVKPLGLKLHNLSDFINIMEKLQSYTDHQAGISHHPNNSHAIVDDHLITSQQMTEKEKLKASNFPASSLKIGSWERVTRYEGDLVAKFYYLKKKLVWEFLESGLKRKIEIAWSDILAIRADIQENEPEILEIELSKPPTFHVEFDPQPRKHTIWGLTTDFSGGEASKWRRHCLSCPPGSLDKHYQKLLRCDSRLHAISRQSFPSLESPIFEPNSYGFYGYSLDFKGGGVLHMNDPGTHCPIPEIPHQDFVQNQLHYQSFMDPAPSSVFHETPSPMSDELGGCSNVFENTRMAIWGCNGDYQRLQSPTYQHLHRGHPDQTFSMNAVQGIGSIVSSTTPLDRNLTFGQNYNLVSYDQAMEFSQVDHLGEMQDQLLIDRSQVGVYDNNFHLAGVYPQNAGSSTNGSDQTSYGMQDMFSEENLDFGIIEVASDELGSGFDRFYDQQQQMVPSNVPTHVSLGDPIMHDQLPWINSATYQSPVEGHDHHESSVDGVNHWR